MVLILKYCLLDQHFSTLSTFVKNAEYRGKIDSTESLINALRIEHQKSNSERLKKGLNEIDTIFLGFL